MCAASAPEPMRIAVLTSLYPSPERPFEGIFAARKWEGMVARGHDVQIVSPAPWAPRALAGVLPEHHARMARLPRRETRDGVRVIRPRYLHVPSRAAGNAERFAATGLRAIGSLGEFDVCVCDYAWPAAAAVEGLKALGLPTVVNGRGSDVLQVMAVPALRPRLAAGLAASAGVTAVSQDLLDAMMELRGSSVCSSLTPNGVDSETFAPGPRDEARRRLSVPEDGQLVLVVGHLIERKDPLLALGAFQAAAASDARLVFVGTGPLRGALEEAVQSAGLADRVTLAGERPPEELADWYRAADLLLLTSSREGRPNVVLEALSSGCAVLATEAGGTAEIVPSERMLARTREAGAIGAMLADLLENPPSPEDQRASVSHLTWARSLDALEAVLDESRGAPAPEQSRQVSASN